MRPPANPPPRRVNRDPASYISDADWSAMASGLRWSGAFGTSAPETDAPIPSSSTRDDTASIASGSTALPDLPCPARAWAESHRRRPADPITFGPFFTPQGEAWTSSNSCRLQDSCILNSDLATIRRMKSLTQLCLVELNGTKSKGTHRLYSLHALRRLSSLST